jgi:phosphoribosylanthranilate isomerase
MDSATVFKAFQIGNDTDIDLLVAPYAAACHYYLFDKATSSYGGSGEQFDWEKLERVHVGKPFFLSGGVGPHDAGRLREVKHPFLYGIDVNSRFELSAGVKDTALVLSFINEVKH